MYWLLHSQGELKEEEAARLILSDDLPIHLEKEQGSPAFLGPLQGAAGSRYALSDTLVLRLLSHFALPSSSVPFHGSS